MFCWHREPTRTGAVDGPPRVLIFPSTSELEKKVATWRTRAKPEFRDQKALCDRRNKGPVSISPKLASIVNLTHPRVDRKQAICCFLFFSGNKV